MRFCGEIYSTATFPYYRINSIVLRISEDRVPLTLPLYSAYSDLPGASSWKTEFARLIDEIPIVETEVLTKHTDEVLHVAYSHDGKRFATSSKDGFVHVWGSGHPTTHEYSADMKTFNWTYTLFSQFNESDTLLLVTGTFGYEPEDSGEIAVFSLNHGFHLQCRTKNEQYAIFGSWYNESTFLSGYISSFLDFNTSEFILHLHKATQKSESEQMLLTKEKYRSFLTFVADVIVANCVEQENSRNEEPSGQTVNKTGKSNFKSESLSCLSSKEEHVSKGPGNSDDQTQSSFLREFQNLKFSNKASCPTSDMDSSMHRDQNDLLSKGHAENESKEGYLDARSKLFIFTCVSRTLAPHQLGFKKITLNERLEALDETEEHDVYMDQFEEMDEVIDFHGDIIGKALSPDHHYLYVMSREWSKNYQLNDPLEPPPTAEEIDVHVIDMTTLTQVGMLRKVQKANSLTDEGVLVYLDCSEHYLASGTDDNHGYIWDRSYGIALAKIPHDNVVNAVAFNPQDPEMLVTVSDDMTIKIWRSSKRCRELGIRLDAQRFGTML